MRIVKMLLAVLICAALFGVAGAEPYDTADLVGAWSPEYMSIAMYCTINEDNTFDVQILEDLPIDIDGFSGTWTFDGISDVTFTHGDQSMTFFWDGKTLSGALGGLPVVLTRDWQPERSPMMTARPTIRPDPAFTACLQPHSCVKPARLRLLSDTRPSQARMNRLYASVGFSVMRSRLIACTASAPGTAWGSAVSKV